MKALGIKYLLVLLLLTIANSAIAQKTATASRTNDGVDEQLRVNLFFYNPDSSLTLADAANTRYNNTYSKAVTSEDAGKPTNVDENVGIYRQNRMLMVERRPLIDDYDTTFLKIYGMRLRDYRLEIIPVHFTAPRLTAYVYDKYTQLKTPVSLSDTTRLKFSVTNTTGTYDSSRFTIYFRPAKYFRSASTGNWNNKVTWQMSDDGTTWQAADVYPVDTTKGVTIMSPHVVTVTETVSVKGVVKVQTGGRTNVNTGRNLIMRP